MDQFSNVSSALLGINPANKVLGVKPLQKGDDRRRREERHGRGKGTASEEEGLTDHRPESPLVLDPCDGSKGSTGDPSSGDAGQSHEPPGPRKLDVVV